jgi:alanyl-tRNA synthetase
VTERLYYEDAYTLHFKANVVERTEYKKKPAIVLDRTYFYPEGGGQQPDNGLLNGIRVIDVQTREADRAVLHILEQPFTDATHVEAQIDADRRRDYMQHHSGQHILSQALSRAAHAETVSVHMSADSMTIDVNRPAISPEEWIAVEDLANQIVQQNLRVRCWYPSSEELATLPIRKMPDVVGKVRIVDMGGFDVTACGGTHVSHTGEIGLIKVVKYERRGDTTRLEFRCGMRAMNDYRSKNEIINRLVGDLSVGYRDIVESVKRLQSESKALRSELKLAKDQLTDAQAQTLLATAQSKGTLRIVARAFEGRDPNDVRLLAQKITTQPDTIALFGVAGEKAQFIFGRAQNVGIDVVPLLKQALALIKSERGGGKPDFAQGGGVPASLAEVTAALESAQQQL